MTSPHSINISRSGPVSGTVRVPGDKSISHRAVILGSLAVGETIISGLLESEDVLCTAEAMRAMGAKVYRDEDGQWRTYGVGVGGLMEPAHVLNMGNSGTSTRLLIGLVAGHAITTFFDGDKSLNKRPMRRVMAPLGEMGATFMTREGARLPLGVQGRDDLVPIEYRLPMPSAQVKSAILLAGLNTPGETTVIEDVPTRDHTENMLAQFGVTLHRDRDDTGAAVIRLPGQQELINCAVDVPADPSSAAFPVVAALINPGSDIKVPNVCLNPARTGLYTTLEEMGAEISYTSRRNQAGEDVANIHVKSTGPLNGIDVPADRVPSMIDEFPVLAVAAACAKGTTHMTGLSELRVKESDRLAMMAQGLGECGVDVEMGEDSLTIHGTGAPPKGGAAIDTAMDHRIAMSFAVLGTVCDKGVEIDDARPIATSFPGFTDMLADLGVKVSGP